MNLTVEAAWIAAGVGAVGIVSTATVALLSSRNNRLTTVAVIDAAHDEKIWDQRSALYVELVAAVMDRDERRQLGLHIDVTTVGAFNQSVVRRPVW